MTLKNRTPLLFNALLLLFIAGCDETPASPDAGPSQDADHPEEDSDTTSDADLDGSGDSDITSDADQGGDADQVDADEADADLDEADADEADADLLPEGERTISGTAYFFDATGPGEITQVHDVEGAEVFLFEHPERRAEVGLDGSFVLEAIPDDTDATVALVHPDFFPMFSAIIHVGDEDIESVTFQSVSTSTAELLSLLLGMDPYSEEYCQMVTTVCAISDQQHTIWAPGEPGVTVTVEPAIAEGAELLYFNTQVIPDRTLEATTTDGGVIVIRAEPGIYTWRAHKEGYEFSEMRIRCEPGWAANGAPPWGIQALSEP